MTSWRTPRTRETRSRSGSSGLELLSTSLRPPASVRPPLWPPLLVVGLTGGIASGKSTIARLLAERGARVISADREGRAVVRPGEPALAELAAAFGPACLLPSGDLDRPTVADRIFARAADRRALNRITHPRIEARLRRALAALQRRPPRSGVVVLEAAVLIEAGWHRCVDVVLVVATQHSTQVRRLIADLGIGPSQAEARVRAQLSLPQRLRLADLQVSGEGSPGETRRQVDAVWEELCALRGRMAVPASRRAGPSDG